MRILHVIPQFPYFGGRAIVGGHASCLLSLALAQYRAGEEVAILSYVEGHSGAVQIEDGPVVYSLFKNRKTRTIGFGVHFCWAAIRWLRTRRNDYDIIHMHSGYADYIMVSALIKSKLRIPTVHTLYCPIPNNGGRWNLPIVHTMIRRWANQLNWRGGMSRNVATSMTNYGMKSARHVRPALDLERLALDEDTSELRAELGLVVDDLVVLFVGNAKPQKNALGVVRALHKIRNDFPNVKLVITTELKHSSSDSDLQRLSAEISELELQSFIVQVGIVDNMATLMKLCDVLVAPFVDTLGPSDYFMAALEAMACGKPVVVSDVGGMPEVISDEVGRLVDPNDSDSIAAGLSAFLASKELRLRTGANARVQMWQQFHPDVIVGEYNEVYRGILK